MSLRALIRVLVIDDSAFSRQAITRMLATSPLVEVVGVARDGEEALRRTFDLEPDLITLDLEMPRMDGFTFLRIVMSKRPTPVMVISGRTGEELSRAIRALREGGARALVLDLRGNGGGVVEGARDVLSQLIGHGIAFRELSKGGKESRHAIPFRLRTVGWALAVLVDAGTASSAEILAAAIRDHERGLLIGEPTFGKGSVQGIFPLRDGSSVHVTISRWLSSDGHPIEGVGLQPDIAVAAGGGQEDGDLSLQRAIEHLAFELGGTTKLRLPQYYVNMRI